jgi:hypothetical protein
MVDAFDDGAFAIVTNHSESLSQCAQSILRFTFSSVGTSKAHFVSFFSLSTYFRAPKVKERLSNQLFWQVQNSKLLLHNCKASSFRPRNRMTLIVPSGEQDVDHDTITFPDKRSGLRCCNNHCRSPQNRPLMQTASRLGAQKKAMELMHGVNSLCTCPSLLDLEPRRFVQQRSVPIVLRTTSCTKLEAILCRIFP